MEETDAALTGSLVISSLSFVNSQFIGETIARFQAEHPDLHITLNASTTGFLAFREADIALAARPTEGRLIAGAAPCR